MFKKKKKFYAKNSFWNFFLESRPTIRGLHGLHGLRIVKVTQSQSQLGFKACGPNFVFHSLDQCIFCWWAQNLLFLNDFPEGPWHLNRCCTPQKKSLVCPVGRHPRYFADDGHLCHLCLALFHIALVAFVQFLSWLIIKMRVKVRQKSL